MQSGVTAELQAAAGVSPGMMMNSVTSRSCHPAEEQSSVSASPARGATHHGKVTPGLSGVSMSSLESQ